MAFVEMMFSYGAGMAAFVVGFAVVCILGFQLVLFLSDW